MNIGSMMIVPQRELPPKYFPLVLIGKNQLIFHVFFILDFGENFLIKKYIRDIF